MLIFVQVWRFAYQLGIQIELTGPDRTCAVITEGEKERGKGFRLSRQDIRFWLAEGDITFYSG
jgi:hypothetical protein